MHASRAQGRRLPRTVATYSGRVARTRWWHLQRRWDVDRRGDISVDVDRLVRIGNERTAQQLAQIDLGHRGLHAGREVPLRERRVHRRKPIVIGETRSRTRDQQGDAAIGGIRVGGSASGHGRRGWPRHLTLYASRRACPALVARSIATHRDPRNTGILLHGRGRSTAGAWRTMPS